MPSLFKLGNAVVSRYPLKLNHVRKFGKGIGGNWKHRFKTYVDFDVMLDGSRLNFVQTHYDHRSSSTKKEETDIILENLKTKDRPFVLLGDLNTKPADEWFRRLLEEGRLHNHHIGPFTYPTEKPYKAIDHILVSEGLRIMNYHVVDEIYISDHLPVIGDVILPR
jgi:endonuclease/exonuclease/phosphatase family metal-dependent hydrolase